ncbi:MAG TPA: MurR/RpiR family transcriptional regulator [Trueperaceae bacterium]
MTSPAAEPPQILRKLESARSAVGPARQKVIDFVLRHPEDVIFLSITELAQQALVSEATIVRLFQEMHYRGYQDFKIRLSRELSGDHQQLDHNIDEGDRPSQVLRSLVNLSVDTLRSTVQIVDENALAAVVDALAQAKRIEFLGVGGSGAVAQDAYHKFLRLGIPVNAVSDGHNAAQVCAVLVPGDVAVFVSHSGSTKDILEAAQLAKEAGATVVAVTRYGRSPLTRIADLSLHTLSAETRYRSEAISSRIAQLVLIDTLMLSLYLRKLPDSQLNLSRARGALASKRL